MWHDHTANNELVEGSFSITAVLDLPSRERRAAPGGAGIAMSTEVSEFRRPADIDRAATAWADLGGATFLNFAGHAAMPRVAVAAACASAALKGRPVGGDAAGFFDASERVRSSLAQLLGARAGDIALTTGA